MSRPDPDCGGHTTPRVIGLAWIALPGATLTHFSQDLTIDHGRMVNGRYE